MDLLGSLYSKGQWHHRGFETLEVDENEILTLEIVILFGVHVQLLGYDIFRSWGFVCQIQHLNSPWFVMELALLHFS